MNYELRAAANQLACLDLAYFQRPTADDANMRAGIMLARAYLAAITADDEELADGTWLKNIGAVRPMAVAADEVYVLGDWRPEHGGCFPVQYKRDRAERRMGDMITYVYGVPINARPTRGDVRRLCAALGIELKARNP